jgi:hypothetical protein
MVLRAHDGGFVIRCASERLHQMEQEVGGSTPADHPAELCGPLRAVVAAWNRDRGALHANIGACAMFAATSRSSVATAARINPIAFLFGCHLHQLSCAAKPPHWLAKYSLMFATLISRI